MTGSSKKKEDIVLQCHKAAFVLPAALFVSANAYERKDTLKLQFSKQGGEKTNVLSGICVYTVAALFSVDACKK